MDDIESNDIICFGDFNVNMLVNNPIMDDIWNVYGVQNVIEGPTCFKTSCGTLIDPILVTNKRRISSSFNVKCGFSDWHNIVGCVTKLQVPKQLPTKIQYRSKKFFTMINFVAMLVSSHSMYVKYSMMLMIVIICTANY